MYFTALSKLCNYRDYSNVIAFRIQALRILQTLKNIKEVSKYFKALSTYIQNFDYLSFIVYLKEIIVKEDLFPFADMFENDWEQIEDVFSWVPYQLVGYYGQYDSYISIDDLDNMSEFERVLALILCKDEFVLDNSSGSYDKEKYETYIKNIKNKYAKNKVKELIKKGYITDEIYKGFVQDYINDQYPKNTHTENFHYLLQRIVRDTGCCFVDMCPEEQDQDYAGWDNLEKYIEIWRDYKVKEKNLFKWLKKIQQDNILINNLYTFFFEEVIPRYR